MRITSQSFRNRRSIVAPIAAIINNVPAFFRNSFIIALLLFAIVAGSLFYAVFRFEKELIVRINTSPHRQDFVNAPPIDSFRGSAIKLHPRERVHSPSLKNEVTTLTTTAHLRKSKLIPPSNSSFLVFYNIFIPKESVGATNAIKILEEQLGQVASSLHRLEGGEAPSKSAVVYYNLISNNETYPEERISTLCKSLHPGLSCQLLTFYETASEAVTLLDLHQYCRNDNDAYVQRLNNDTRVVYIHSKGSYHPSDLNNRWRREMTNAVLHRDCLFPPDDQCDICGAQFYTRFAFMFPGNMWTAKCSYIQKLLSPEEGGEYETLKRESIIRFFKLRLWGQLNSTLLKDQIDYFGLGRYQSEHWVGSHPSIRPCELHKKNINHQTVTYGKVNPAKDYEWSLEVPRESIIGESRDGHKMLETNEDAQFREYFYLPGNLLKWFTLYKKDGVPPQDSWIWDFFPGGHKWKELVRQYGENAVDEMAKQSLASHSAFAEKNERKDSYNFEDDGEVLSDINDTAVVFYHITFPHGKDNETILALQAQFDFLSHGQLKNESLRDEKKRPVLVYYSVAGGSRSNLDFVSNLCQAKSSRVTCRKIGEFESANTTGETLQQLHRFCQTMPSSKVSYITNQLPTQHGVNDTQPNSLDKVRAHTSAATSELCLNSLLGECNVCGMEFYPLPFQHFVGNMFASSCDYVNNLLPPSDFEVAMNNMADDVLIMHLQSYFTTELTPFTPRNLGLLQYSVEHWIGSHPNLTPCDIAPVAFSSSETGQSNVPNDYSISQEYNFSLELAPRRSSIPPESSHIDEEKEKRVREKDEIIFREYYYLAGNLHRWYKLYNNAPPINSWVWKWFPKGDEWLRGNLNHGTDIVKKLSEPFTNTE